ncbi:hypothetical protein [Paludisphaera rhizosphaerae]|uniref:hypothetical protein n=1 Tax=Paludisphaera rhizosphaerae TaxID=2711216 RepID=UPI0013EE30BD|nr:hypothetical protein [Paludisphaera rhizosphaerae]
MRISDTATVYVLASMALTTSIAGMSLESASTLPSLPLLATEVATPKHSPALAWAGRARFEEQLRKQYLADLGTKISLGLLPDDPLHAQLLEEFPKRGRSHQERLTASYAWLAKKADIRVNGWRGALLNVVATPEGHEVTVALSPALSTPRGGGLTAMPISERYLRTDKGWTFLGADPAEGAPPILTFH